MVNWINRDGEDIRNLKSETKIDLVLRVLLEHLITATDALPAKRWGDTAKYEFPFSEDTVLSVTKTNGVVTWYGFRNEY